jgi:ribose transport system substrate-binding protein
MKKKLLSLLLVLAMVSSLLVACGGSGEKETEAGATDASKETESVAEETKGEEEEETEDTGDTGSSGEIVAKEAYHFEIVSKGFQSTYWQAVYKGAQASAEKYGITMEFVGPNSESDIADQVQMLNNAINKGPAAIGLAALDTKAALDGIQAAVDKNIPIIGFDSGVPGAPEGAVLANASTDNYVAGGVAAEGMYEGVKDRIANADGQVRIGEVNQDATSESITQRGLGFIDRMIELLATDGKTVAVVGNDFYINNAKGATVAEADADVVIEVRVPSQTTTELTAIEASTILNKEDTIAIFGSNQTAAEGLVTANENLGVMGTGDDDIIGVGFDSGSVIKAAVADGTLFGAVTQAPVRIGEVLVELLIQVANGEEVSNVDTGAQWYNAGNIESPEIAQNLYD